MNIRPVCLASLAAACALTLHAQDTVTIPKSRLEELEKKEAELQKLQQATNRPVEKTLTSEAPAPTPMSPAQTRPAAAARPTKPAPVVASLPPLKAGEVVESLDLAAQYQAEPLLADKRYRGQRIAVRGEIVGFEKPILRNNYRILLQGPDRVTSVVCDLLTPEKFSAVFPAEHGTQLVGQFGENRQTLAKLGETVMVRGRCKGVKGSSVLVVADNFETVK